VVNSPTNSLNGLTNSLCTVPESSRAAIRAGPNVTDDGACDALDDIDRNMQRLGLSLGQDCDFRDHEARGQLGARGEEDHEHSVCGAVVPGLARAPTAPHKSNIASGGGGEITATEVAGDEIGTGKRSPPPPPPPPPGAPIERPVSMLKKGWTACTTVLENRFPGAAEAKRKALQLADVAKKNARLLADAAMTCRECGAKFTTSEFVGFNTPKFCSQCSAENPSVADVAASMAIGALNLVHKANILKSTLCIAFVQ
jgi:ribosomal protein L40E